jgi:hypothetical protein
MLRKVAEPDQRELYMPKILKLLAAGPASTAAIAARLELRPDVTASYLHHMHHDLRAIRRWQERPGFSATLWRIGEDPHLPQPGSSLLGSDDKSDVKRTVVPARQLGMTRDPLVAAMFGPAREVVVC